MKSSRHLLPSFTTFLLLVVSFQSINGNEQEENCEACSIKIEGTTDVIRESLKSRDPIKLDTPDPCANCNFKGITSIQYASEEVCSKKVTENVNGKDVICYDHNMTFSFTNIEYNCVCTLPVNPADVVKMISDRAKDPLQGVQCMEEGQTPMDPKKMSSEMADMAMINPATLMTMAECRPSPPKAENPFAKPPPKTVTGGMNTTYASLKMDVVLRACEGSEDVKTVGVNLHRVDPELVKFKCVYDENNKAFMEPCQCFGKTDYMHKIMTSSMNGFFPCYGDKEVNKQTDILKELVCNELIEED